MDTLDGRSTNRYFYRAIYVDRAHNRSALGPCGMPVRLPNVVPPRAPSVTKTTADERRITLAWVSNREPDLLEYRVFRAPSMETARDLRLMTQVGAVAADPDPAARPATVEWTDEPIPGLTDFWYRVVAVDRQEPVDARGGGGNLSAPSALVKARAVDTLPPNIPAWISTEWIAEAAGQVVRLAWRTDEPSITCVVQRRPHGGGAWSAVSGRLNPSVPPFDFEYLDRSAVPGMAYEYRILAQDPAGNKTTNFDVRLVLP
jgi:hypothetical protein